MEVNLRSSRVPGGGGTAGKVVSVDSSGEDILPDNPVRNVAYLRVVSGGPITIYFATKSNQGVANGSVTLAATDPPWPVDRWNGPISAIASVSGVLGVIEFDLDSVSI